MAVDFGNRTIDAIRIQPWGMALPHYHLGTPHGSIMMLTSETDILGKKLAQRSPLEVTYFFDYFLGVSSSTKVLISAGYPNRSSAWA